MRRLGWILVLEVDEGDEVGGANLDYGEEHDGEDDGLDGYGAFLVEGADACGPGSGSKMACHGCDDCKDYEHIA